MIVYNDSVSELSIEKNREKREGNPIMKHFLALFLAVIMIVGMLTVARPEPLKLNKPLPV